jgi:hypothetical protein
MQAVAESIQNYLKEKLFMFPTVKKKRRRRRRRRKK